jgi:hypothetical protein
MAAVVLDYHDVHGEAAAVAGRAGLVLLCDVVCNCTIWYHMVKKKINT